MKWSRLFVFACFVALSLSPAIAQQRIVLPIELTRNGLLVAKPQLNLYPGIEGRLSLNGQAIPERSTPAWLMGLDEDVLVTPTVRGDEITLAFSILRRTRCGDDRGVHDRSSLERQSLARQIPVHSRQYLCAEYVALQQSTEIEDRRLIRD